MQSSMYLLRLQSCNKSVNTTNCGSKHDSYQRYLNRLRYSCNISKKI
jgi:hypothetical protein